MPMIHNGDALTELLSFVHIVRGKQDSHALLVERSNAVPDEKPGLRIKAIGGFVEKQHIWCVHERAGEHKSLRHATRVVVYVIFTTICQAEFGQQPICSRLSFCAGHRVVAGMKGQKFARSQALVQVALLRYNGDTLPDMYRVSCNV